MTALPQNIKDALPVAPDPIIIGGTVTVNGTVTTVPPANATTNVTQWAGNPVDTNSGLKSVGTLRVVLATDQPQLTAALKVDGSGVTQPVTGSVAVTNAAGAAAVNIQDGGNSITVDGTVAISGTVPVSGSVTVANGAGAAAVNIQDGGNSITVDGTVAISGTVTVAGTVAISGTVTVAGTVTTTPPANASTNVTQWAGTAVDTNNGLHSAGTLRVVLATDQPQLTNALKVDGSAVTQPVSGTVAISGTVTVAGTVAISGTVTVAGTVTTTPPANASTNVTQWAGVAVDTNSGNHSTGTLRVVLATDQPALTNALKVDGSAVTQPVSGTVNVGTIAGAITPGTGATNLGKVQGGAYTAGDVGVGAWAVRRDSGSALTGVGNEYIPLTTDASGKLWVSGAELDGAAFAAGASRFVLGGGVVTTAAPTYVTGNMNPLSLNTAGGLRVDASGTAINVNTHAVTQGTSPWVVSGTLTTTPPANATTNVTQWAGTAVDTNSGLHSAGTLRVVIATDQPALTNALKVDGSAVTQPVSGTVTVGNAAGAAAVNIQDGGNSITVDGTVTLGAGAAAIGSVSVNNAAGAAAVNIQDGGNSITVDGTVTLGAGAAAIGSVSVSNAAGAAAVNIQDGGNSITVDGTVAISGTVTVAGTVAVSGTVTVAGTVTTTPPANATTNVTQLAGTAVDVNSGVKSAGTLRVVLATDQPALTNALKVDGSAVTQPVSGTVAISGTVTIAGAVTNAVLSVVGGGTEATAQRVTLANDSTGLLQVKAPSTAPVFVRFSDGTLAVNTLPVNQTQWAGTAVDVNSGVKSAGTLRVVLATDQPALTNALKVDGSAVTQPVSGTVTTTPPANATTNVTQLAGTAVDVNSGNHSAGTLRVVLATDQPILTVAPTNITSAAYEASHVVKASAGTLFSITGYNSKTTSQFIQVHDAAALPADGVAPKVIFIVPGSSNFAFELHRGRGFTTGIVVCNSSTGPTKTIGAADCWFDVQFA